MSASTSLAMCYLLVLISGLAARRISCLVRSPGGSISPILSRLCSAFSSHSQPLYVVCIVTAFMFCADDAASSLLQVAPLQDTDIEAVLLRLEQRLTEVESAQPKQLSTLPISQTVNELPKTDSKWSLALGEHWQPCPMGLLSGGIRPNLAVM